MNQQLTLLHRSYAEKIDPSSQVDRMPGTPDAPCHCGREECGWPWCTPEQTVVLKLEEAK